MIALPWLILLKFIFSGILVLSIVDIWLIIRIRVLNKKVSLLNTNTDSLKEGNRSIIIKLILGLFLSSILTSIIKEPFKGFLPYGGNDGVSTGLFILISLFLLTVYLFKREKDLNNILKYGEETVNLKEEEINEYKRKSNNSHWSISWLKSIFRVFGIIIILTSILILLLTMGFKLYFFIMDNFL